MANDFERFFQNLGNTLRQGVAEKWAEAVESELVQPIRAAAPVGATDHLQQSVRKVQGVVVGEQLPEILKDTLSQEVRQFNGTGENAGVTQWVVMAGGPLTTKPVQHGKTAEYDYALATEYGTGKEHSHAFFWPTIRAHSKRLVQRAEQIVAGALPK